MIRTIQHLTGINSSMKRVANHIRHLPIHPQWLLGKRLPPSAARRMCGVVLDVGCSDRWIQSHLASEVTYIGLDFPSTGKTLYRATPDIYGDATRLPIESGCIDGIVCLEVLEHVRDHQAALREFSRVLKPGGALVLSMPFLYPIHDAPHDFQRLTRYGLQRDLLNSGFDVVTITKTGHSMHAAGIVACLALTGWLKVGLSWHRYALLPITAAGVLLINLAARVLSMFLPDWDAIGIGYMVEATRRTTSGSD